MAQRLLYKISRTIFWDTSAYVSQFSSKENLFSQKPVQVLYTPLGNPISVQPAQKSATTRSFREDSCCIREEIQKALQ